MQPYGCIREASSEEGASLGHYVERWSLAATASTVSSRLWVLGQYAVISGKGSGPGALCEGGHLFVGRCLVWHMAPVRRDVIRSVSIDASSDALRSKHRER